MHNIVLSCLWRLQKNENSIDASMQIKIAPYIDVPLRHSRSPVPPMAYGRRMALGREREIRRRRCGGRGGRDDGGGAAHPCPRDAAAAGLDGSCGRASPRPRIFRPGGAVDAAALGGPLEGYLLRDRIPLEGEEGDRLEALLLGAAVVDGAAVGEERLAYAAKSDVVIAEWVGQSQFSVVSIVDEVGVVVGAHEFEE